MRPRRSPSVAGKVVLITGAARGIGAATARLLAKRGATVVLTDWDADTLAATARSLGAQHASYVVDVLDPTALREAVEATVQRYGRLDVAVANAGVSAHGTVLAADPELVRRAIDINLHGPLNLAFAAVPHLVRSQGYLQVVCSMASFVTLPGALGYSASKAGAEMLATTLRMELAAHGIAVGSVHPSWIDTDLVRGAEARLPTFAKMRGSLPWPANSTMSADRCAHAMVRAIARRQRRVYIPRKVVVMSACRPLLHSAWLERRLQAGYSQVLPQIDEEVRRVVR